VPAPKAPAKAEPDKQALQWKDTGSNKEASAGGASVYTIVSVIGTMVLSSSHRSNPKPQKDYPLLYMPNGTIIGSTDLGRFKTEGEAKAAAQRHFDTNGPTSAPTPAPASSNDGVPF
jgi:hypothetical protein